METSSVKNCSICNEELDEEDRWPRNLPCSHCFCTECIRQLIMKNDKKCPFCRQSFEAKSATDFKINITTLDLVKYIKVMEVKLSQASEKETTMSRSDMVSDLKKSSYKTCRHTVASLKSSEDRIQRAIDDNEELKRQLLDYHSKIKKDAIAKLNLLQDECDVRVAYIDAENERLKKQLEQLREQQKRQNDVKRQLDSATKLVQLDEAIDEAEAFNEDAEKWLRDFQMSFQRVEKIQVGIRTNTKKLKDKLATIVDVLKTFEEEEIHEREQMRDMVLQLYSKTVLKVADLKNMSTFVRALLKAEGLHAVHHNQGKSRRAKLTLSENRVLLHCLKDGEISPGVCTLQHEDVMKLVDPSSRLVFLELGVNEYSLGRMFIRLTHDTKRSQNFSALCTGEKGPSYVNSFLIRVRKKGADKEDIVAGDYEHNNEKGGKAVVDGAGKETSGFLRRPRLAGSVFGWLNGGDSTAAQFGISTRNNPSYIHNVIFGSVESGLQILTMAISTYPDITDVKIIDAGIVLNI